jgi:hypothetical protein
MALPQNVGKTKPPDIEPVKSAEVVPSPLTWDKWVYRIVVISLSLTVLGALVGAIVLEMAKNISPPDLLVALGSAAVGALAGLLAPPPSGRS